MCAESEKQNCIERKRHGKVDMERRVGEVGIQRERRGSRETRNERHRDRKG